MKNRFFIMRHGESIANRKGLIVSEAENAIDEFGLTSLGAEQVMKSALKTRLDEHTKIVSSDYLRARETAEILHGIVCASNEIVFDKRLRERQFGEWELQDHSHYDQVWENDLRSPNRRINGVESVSSVLNRGLSVINDLDTAYSGETILLVGHGDVLQILLTFQHGMEPCFHRTISPLRNAEIRSVPMQSSQKIA